MLRKRIISLLLVLCMLFTALPFQAFAAEEIIASGLHDFGPIEWKITADGTLTITGSRTMQDKSTYEWTEYGDLITRIVIEDGIVSIAKGAFEGMSNVSEVYLGNGLEAIHENAFKNCTALTSVRFPASLKTIDANAFFSCNSLKEISFDSNTTDLTIGSYAFSGTAVKELRLPGGVKQLYGNAFSDCQQLTSLHLEEGIESIDHNTFANCPALGGHLYLPASLIEIGAGNFDYGTLWTSLEIRTPVRANLLFWNNAQLKQVVIAGETTYLPNDLFLNCTALESVIINSALTEIGWNTFDGCTALKAITLPETLTTIGIRAFDNTGLTELVLPDAVTNIGMSAFANCGNLTNVVFGDSITSLDNSLFENCFNLTTVDLANTTYIGWSCFNYTGLVSVEIPETVELIESCAFANCADLTQIHFLGNAPVFGSNNDTFQGTTATAYYNPEREGWTDEAMQDYGGDITWAIYGHEHSYTSVVTPATCTEAGYTTHTCAECGDTYTDAEVDALGHDLTEWEVTKEATCIEAGSQSRVCNTCAEVFTEEIPATGHDYVENVCSVCGYEKPALSAPQILSCYSKLQTSVKVTWELVEGADGYELWRSVTPDDEDSWNRIKTITNGETDRYTNQDLTEGVTYYYKVRAYMQDADGNKTYSEFSNVDYMPAAVVWDGPYSNATFRIRLRWNEIGGAHGYQLWRLNENGEWKIVKTLGDKGNTLTNNQGATTAYSNTGLTSGDNYTYKMRAFMITEDGRKVFGAYSDEFTVAVMPETPVLAVVSPKEGRVQLNWESVHGAAGYQVWMYADGSWSIIKSVTDGSTAYTKTGLTAGTEYKFRVRAYTEVDGKKTFGEYSEILSSKASGPAIVASGKCGDNLTWALDDTGTLTISGTGDMYGYDGDAAPWAELDPTRAVIESGVTSIGDYAFALGKNGLMNLREFSLPKTLKEIGYGAFSDSRVDHIVIPDSVTVIKGNAFADSDLTSITLSKGLKEISDGMFYRCNYLTEITIPEGVTKLGMDAFSGCARLVNISLPETLTTIANYTFSNCDALEVLVLPDSVTSVDSSAFEDCNGLVSVYLPENLKVIPSKAFYGCNALVEIVLPTNLTTVKENAFKGCNSLAYFYFPGTEAQLSKIEVYEGNDPLLNADVYLVTIITEQPKDVTVNAGGNVRFHVEVSRDNCTYQWYYLSPDAEEWLPCTQSSAKTDTLTFTATKDMDGYYFLCEITDPYGNSGDTEAALLTVK